MMEENIINIVIVSYSHHLKGYHHLVEMSARLQKLLDMYFSFLQMIKKIRILISEGLNILRMKKFPSQ